MPTQLELICGQCPIVPECDEDSLFCLLRFLTKPNEAQKQLFQVTKTRKPVLSGRQKYFQRYYQKNREKKLAEANERNARLRGDIV